MRAADLGIRSKCDLSHSAKRTPTLRLRGTAYRNEANLCVAAASLTKGAGAMSALPVHGASYKNTFDGNVIIVYPNLA